MSVLLLLLPFSLPAHHVVETLECFLALFIPPQVPTMTVMRLPARGIVFMVLLLLFLRDFVLHSTVLSVRASWTYKHDIC